MEPFDWTLEFWVSLGGFWGDLHRDYRSQSFHHTTLGGMNNKLARLDLQACPVHPEQRAGNSRLLPAARVCHFLGEIILVMQKSEAYFYHLSDFQNRGHRVRRARFQIAISRCLIA